MISIVGGFLLIIGAFLFFKGNIYYGSISYLLADFIWITNAIRIHDYIGAAFIIIGFLLGIGVFLKMHIGLFSKNIDKKTVF
jgi:hypothetical protein